MRSRKTTKQSRKIKLQSKNQVKTLQKPSFKKNNIFFKESEEASCDLLVPMQHGAEIGEEQEDGGGIFLPGLQPRSVAPLGAQAVQRLAAKVVFRPGAISVTQ